MLGKSIKRIGLICLCSASLTLVGCFHVPDEDWLPSKNKVDTSKNQEDVQVEEALNSFMDGINIISSEWSEMKNNEEIAGEENETQGNLNDEPEEIQNETGESIDENNIIMDADESNFGDNLAE